MILNDFNDQSIFLFSCRCGKHSKCWRMILMLIWVEIVLYLQTMCVYKFENRNFLLSLNYRTLMSSTFIIHHCLHRKSANLKHQLPSPKLSSSLNSSCLCAKVQPTWNEFKFRCSLRHIFKLVIYYWQTVVLWAVYLFHKFYRNI